MIRPRIGHSLPIATSLFATTLSIAWTATAAASTDTRMPAPSPITAGYTHALIIRPNGKLHTWGGNFYGQQGNGNNTDAYNPILVNLDAVVTTAAGEHFSLAINTRGQLYSWGRNTHGQLGRGTITEATNLYRTPGRVGTLETWRVVAAGQRHAVAIKYDGSLWGWGSNANGQLGQGSTATAAYVTPVQLGTSRNWIAVSAGQAFTLALAADGTLWATGDNTNGQVGQGNTNNTTAYLSLTQVGSNRWRAISAGGAHVIAIRDDGTLWSWGLNDSGQLGDSSKTTRSTPNQRGTLIWRSVSAGYRHSLAISPDGVRYGWGQNTNAEAGLGNSSEALTPSSGTSGTNTEYVAAGKSWGFTMKANGEFLTWGVGTSGQLGQGSSVTQDTTPSRPFSASPTDNWATNAKPGSLAAGTRHTVGIRSNGKLDTWGTNLNGQLGPLNPSEQLTPRVGVTEEPFISVAVGEGHTIAVRADGTLWAWGSNQTGEIGNGSTGHANVLSPVQIGGSNRWMKVTAHYAISFGLRADGTLWGWGDNTVGQVGDGDTTGSPRYSPTQIGSDKRWVAIASAAKNTYGITSDGKLWAWGVNTLGQLGNGTSAPDPTGTVRVPTQVGSATNWVTVGAGAGFVIAIQANGRLYGFGADDASNCQLADHASGDQLTTPTWLFTSSLFYTLSVSHTSTLTAGPGGRVKGWGGNTQGELGFGTTSKVCSLADTSFFFTKTIVSGPGHTVQIEPYSGLRQASGANTYGTLGDGTKDNNSVYPVQLSSGF